MTRLRSPSMILLATLAILLAACETYAPPAASVYGTLHTDFSGYNTDLLVDSVAGYVVLDTDSDYTNGYARRVSVSVPFASIAGTEGLTYCIDEAEAGDYYLYAVFDTDGSGEFVLESYGSDACGFYGNNTSNDYVLYVPSSANLSLGSSGYRSCDFWVGVPTAHVP